MRSSDIYRMPTIPQWWENRDDEYAKEHGPSEPIRLLTGGWHNHLPELIHENIDVPVPRLTTKIHFDPYIDGYRVCTVGSAWFDGKPFMVFRHAGRSGHDEYDRFITDENLFWEMIAYVRSLLRREELMDVVDPEQDDPCLDEFYGYEIKVRTVELSDATCAWVGNTEYTKGQTCSKRAMKDDQFCPWHRCCHLDKLFYDIIAKKVEGNSSEVLDKLNEMRVIASYTKE